MRLVSAMRNSRKIVIQVLVKERLDRLMQRRLVVFHRQHVVALRADNLLGDVFLATHRVDRDDRALHVDLVDQRGNGRDFVRFLLGRDLAQRQALFARPRTDQVQRPQPRSPIVRPTRRLAVDGDRRPRILLRVHETRRDPTLKARLKRFRAERGKHAANAIPRGDPIGQFQ